MSDPVDPGRKTAILGVSWTLTTLCTLCVCVRLHLRSRPPIQLGWDDYTIAFATVLQLFHQAVVTIACYYGAGMHDEDLTPDQHVNIIKWFWITTTPALVISVVARVSSAILLKRIFNSVKWFKIFLLFFTVLQAIVGALAIVAVYTQVQPLESLWNPKVHPVKVGNRKFELVTTTFAQSLFAFTDLAYVFIPVSIIWKLNMPLRRKIGLGVILSLTLVSFVGSVMKAVTAAFAKTQFESSLVILWSNLEQTINIIMNCVPALRAVVLKVEFVRSVSASVVRLLTRRGSDSSLSSGHSDNNKKGYHDLERNGTARRRRAGDTELLTGTVTDQKDIQDVRDIELDAYNGHVAER
ncbi:hypothetical protein GGR51DRAFT_397534 [Nemania sp. FL0031]|nr:hypothetical protein GGR51DRAFT_397534 [Nemania sp. FL0031]